MSALLRNGGKWLLHPLQPTLPACSYNYPNSAIFPTLLPPKCRCCFWFRMVQNTRPLPRQLLNTIHYLQHENETITLTGTTSSSPHTATYQQFCHMLANDSIASLHLLSITPSTPQQNDSPSTTLTTPPATISPDIQNLLQAYPMIFQPPHSLPPSRPHDHHIPLLPNTPPSMLNHTDTPTPKKKRCQISFKKCSKMASLPLAIAHTPHPSS
jgi:hypothetical protein